MKAFVAIPYEDDSGKHDRGEEIDLPRNTDEEKANFDRLIEYGIFSTTPPED